VRRSSIEQRVGSENGLSSKNVAALTFRGELEASFLDCALRADAMYCSHCYQNGQFVLPDISVEQMQARVREKIVEFGMSGFLAGIFIRRIPKLARWQK
jgi:hypothetical protein